MTIRYIVGVNMEKVIKIKKELTTLEKKHLINKIVSISKNYKYNDLINYIDKLIYESFDLLESNIDITTINILDNNIFEIENLIEEVELNININANIFVYLNNKTNEYLNKLFNTLKQMVLEENDINNVIITIRKYQKNIISKYINSLYKYLIELNKEKLLDIERITQIINEDISINDWKQIYKVTNNIMKLENINKESLKEIYIFEVAYFLINMEE